MTTTKPTINISQDASDAIRAAIESVYEKTNRRPKYSEIQAIYKTSNSYIQHVLADWINERSDELNDGDGSIMPVPIELNPDSVAAIVNALTVEVRNAQAVADAKLDAERAAMYAIKTDSESELAAQMIIADDYFHEVERLNAELQTNAQSAVALTASLSAEKLRADDADAKIMRLTDDVAHLTARNGALDTELAKTLSERNAAMSERDSAKMRFDEMTARNERLNAELETRTKQYNSLNDELLGTARKLSAAEGRCDALEQTISELRANGSDFSLTAPQGKRG